MLLSHKLPRLLTSVVAALLAVSTLALPAAAKGKKGKVVAAPSKSKSGKQARAGSSRRESAKLGRRGRHRAAKDLTENMPHETIGNHSIVPDRIEVLEYGSTSSTDTARWLNPAVTRSSASDPATEVSAPSRGRKVSIDSERVIQIQQALATRGFYAGQTTGVYDDATVDAMRRFQVSSKVAATGYPTAHSLKRLGLGNW